MKLKDVGARVRDARVAAGLSQEALARAIGAGKTAIQKLERGDHATSSMRLRDICQALRCSADWILGLDGADLPPPAAPAQSLIDEWFRGLDARTQRALLGAALAVERPDIVRDLLERLSVRPVASRSSTQLKRSR